MDRKMIHILWLSLLVVLATSCQSDDVSEAVGYLHVNVDTNSLTNARSIVENYDAKRLAVKIISEQGAVVEQTDNYTTDWGAGKTFTLPAGTYTIQAASYGFDGGESGFDTPYYTGSTQIAVKDKTDVTANLTCTLANVKVTVNFDQSFKDAFAAANATVKSALTGINPLTYTMYANTRPGYFPVGNLTATVMVINKSGASFTSDYEITDVKARDHYILNYKVADTGNGAVKVEVDDAVKTYTFSFPVSTKASTSLAMGSVDPWTTVAYVDGRIAAVEAGKTLDDAAMTFEYRKQSESVWTSTAATKSGDTYRATLRSLSPTTDYVCRMAYNKGDDAYVSGEMYFTTDTQNKVPNLSFDDWVKSGKNYYANASTDAMFWDSGNGGANTLSEVNPTRPEESDVVSGKAARLGSATAAGQFAAASLFTGRFKSATLIPLGAKLDFGQPFTDRPTQLTGYFKYSAGTVTHTKKDFMVKGESRDSCSIYIALADWSAPFAVSTGDNQFVNLNDASIIAYGELAKEKSSPATPMSTYERFTIDIKYRDLTRRPTYILIVCSASKYGDYFTGSTSSVLYLDEFDLIYGEPVKE